MKPVSKTAYYCCAVRALDAGTSRPACGDHIAQRFMTPEAWALFEPFRDLGPPNASNVVRHRLIDDRLRAAIQARPDVGVVIIGAGFDTRAFRLPGGRWVELDEPSIIALKEAQLPARESPNPLTRVAIEFDREPLDAAPGAVSAASSGRSSCSKASCPTSRCPRCSGCSPRSERRSRRRQWSAISLPESFARRYGRKDRPAAAGARRTLRPARGRAAGADTGRRFPPDGA